MPKIATAFIGAGRRMQTIYLPVLQQLNQDFDLVGVTTRSQKTAQQATQATGLEAFGDLSTLIRKTNPDLFIVCVPPEANVEVSMQAISTGKAVLLETPLSFSMRKARKLAHFCKKATAPIGVTEQKPFLPWELFKQTLLQTGVFGQIIMVENDFRSYDYHAIAQLRNYLGYERKPVRIQSLSKEMLLPVVLTESMNERASTLQEQEIWDLAHILFDDGTFMVHHFTSQYKVKPYRTFQSLRIYGEKGSLVNDQLAVLDVSSGQTHRPTIEVKHTPIENRAPTSIATTLPNGEKVTWNNPFKETAFTDDQVALAIHLQKMREAILEGGSSLYQVQDALIDQEIIKAMRLSGLQNGASVSFPLNVSKEMIACMTKKRFWKKVRQKFEIWKDSKKINRT